MEVQVSLTSDRVDSSDLQDLTRDLCAALNDNTNVSAALAEGPPVPNSRGEPITLGVIALAFVTSGAAAALFEVFKAYFERNTELEVTLKRDDGGEMVVRAENVRSGQIDQTLDMARAFLEGAK